MRALVECLGVTQTDASKASAGPADLPHEPDPARAKERFEVLFEQAGPDAPAAQPARHTSYTHLGPVAGPPEESGRNRPDVGVGDRRPPAVGFDLDQFRTPGTPARPAPHSTQTIARYPWRCRTAPCRDQSAHSMRLANRQA